MTPVWACVRSLRHFGNRLEGAVSEDPMEDL
jgi:hypothetical protein